jgi:hypothetical protein
MINFCCEKEKQGVQSMSLVELFCNADDFCQRFAFLGDIDSCTWSKPLRHKIYEILNMEEI